MQRARLSRVVWAIAAVQLAALVATSTRYGYHRDELYFIVAGSHPAFGYPDQPPLVPLLCAGLNALWHSLLLLRLPSAIVAGATTVLSALVARELGGGRRPQLIAAGCAAGSGFALAVGHFVTTTTTPDLLSTTALVWLVIRAVSRRSGPPLLGAGAVVGVGFEAKPQVGIVATVLTATLLAVGPRWPFRSWWALGGVATAVALAAPYLIWQQLHGWPQVTVAGNIGGSAEGGRVGFIPFQLIMVSPLLVPVD